MSTQLFKISTPLNNMHCMKIVCLKANLKARTSYDINTLSCTIDAAIIIDNLASVSSYSLTNIELTRKSRVLQLIV